MDETTKTTTRTDVHSPKSLVTEDYDYVMSVDSRAGDSLSPFGPPPSEWLIEQMRRRAEAARLVASSPLDRGLNQCHHCGAHIRWSAVLHHRPSDTHTSPLARHASTTASSGPLRSSSGCARPLSWTVRRCGS